MTESGHCSGCPTSHPLGGAAAADTKPSKKCSFFEEGPRRAADPQKQAENCSGCSEVSSLSKEL